MTETPEQSLIGKLFYQVCADDEAESRKSVEGLVVVYGYMLQIREGGSLQTSDPNMKPNDRPLHR